jgi:hypothetical protein
MPDNCPACAPARKDAAPITPCVETPRLLAERLCPVRASATFPNSLWNPPASAPKARRGPRAPAMGFELPDFGVSYAATASIRFATPTMLSARRML